MGWGFMQGLGQGLQDVSKLPQQYYQNTRQEKMEEDQLKTAALQRALLDQSMHFNEQYNPLRLQEAQGAIKGQDITNASALVKAHAGVAPVTPDARAAIDAALGGGLVDATGNVLEDPTEVARKAAVNAQLQSEATKNNADAAESGHRGSYYDAEGVRARAEATNALADARLRDAQTAAGGFRPAGLGAKSPGASQILSHFDRVSKQYEDITKGSWQFMAATPEAKMQMIKAADDNAIAEAIRRARASGVIITPQDEAAAKGALGEVPAVQGALGGTPTSQNPF